jgi:pimeloyl-ACP methyl ester carboxylesterase
MVQDPPVSAPIVFSDIPREEGEAAVKHFARHSAISFTGELTYAGYKDVPVSYLFCEEDLTLPAKTQRAGIDLIEEVSGRKVDVTCIKTGHCPTISAPKLVVDWMLDVAKKV